MKIYAAGNSEHMEAVHAVGLRMLCSYWYMKNNSSPPELSLMDETSIMDSGLFSLMFGAEKGTLPSTHEAYEEYTNQYLEAIDRWGYKGFFVESDVHRLLGMESVFKLRELYRPFGSRVIHVWHYPEGEDGLKRLAVAHDYIAISVPELRLLSGQKKGEKDLSTNRVVPMLLNIVRDACQQAGVKMPRVHLLGGTVKSLMETTQAYSADSTSWLYGVRMGKATIFNPTNGMVQVSSRSKAFYQFTDYVRDVYPHAIHWAESKGEQKEYFTNMVVVAAAYRMHQDWLDTHYKPIEMRF